MTLIFRHRPNVFICLVFLVQTVFGGTTGKLAGRVTDKDKNEPLIGANVMVVGTTLGAATDLDGNYYVLQVPPGTYSIRFTMIGYQSLVINDVRVKVDLTTTINGALVESVVGLEEVVVQAERAMIQTDVTYSQANISSEEVDLLPVEEFQDVIALQAGVVVTGGDIHVRGGRGGEISYMVDGITVTDPYNAGVAIEIENNAIQELQFISGTFNAEYGQAMSGIVNIVTKDGDYNHFSGNLSLNGGSYFSKGDPSFTIIPGYETEPENEVNATDMNLFPRLDKFIPSTVQDLSGSLSGPVIPGRISFFASGRIKRDNGYLKGQRIFDPHSFIWVDENNNYEIDDSLGLGNGYVPSLSSRTAGESLRKAIDSLRRADEFDWISMDWSEQKTGQLKLSWRFTPRIKLSFNRMYSETHSQYYDHSYRWNPDGRPHEFQTNTGNLFRMDISLSQSTFANILFSNAVNHFRRHLSDDPDYYKQIQNEFDGWASDPLSDNLYEVDPKIFDFATGNNFYVGGQYMGIYNRKSIVNTLKTEITSQINSKHQIKSGFEYRKTNITMNDITVQYNAYTNFDPVYSNPLVSPTHDAFSSGGDDGRNPVEISGYIQDKIESDEIIVNVGLRYDYFDPQWKIVNDTEDPNYLIPLKPINRWFDTDGNGEISDEEMTSNNLKSDNDRLESNAYGDTWFEMINPKTQISPRFALAFPITDKGYLHFSYGHFFQNPNFSYIYTNPEFEVPAASGVNTTMGNADMEAQRTTQYEIGFSQQIGQDVGIEITGYFKDIRNLNATKIHKSFIAGDRYGMYVNKDHANSQGITIALSKRSLQNFSGNLDYTYSVSEGNASDPTAAFYDEQSNVEPEKMLVPLDWDQRHTINATMTYHPTAMSGISLVFNYGSGFPYTTEFVGVRTAFENNALKPASSNLDLKSYYNFIFMRKRQISVHINIYNFFDVRNEETVYNDTGRSTYSLLPTYTAQYSGPALNTLEEYLVRPHYYSAPRQIKIGLSVSL